MATTLNGASDEAVDDGRMLESVRRRLHGQLQIQRWEAAHRLERKLFEARAANHLQARHGAEPAIESADSARCLAAAHKERALIREIDRALGKLAEGSQNAGQRADEASDGGDFEPQHRLTSWRAEEPARAWR